MKFIWLSITVLLTGCSSLDQMVCYGTGTCAATGITAAPAKHIDPTPQTVITGQGTYMIIRNQSTGAISAVLPVSKTK